MEVTVTLTLNGRKLTRAVPADTMLLEFLRSEGCLSVKRGCETSCCGLCTVWLDGQPVQSCSTLAVRCGGRAVTTLEGVQREAEVLGGCLADQGGEQCGFCNPGFLMNVLAMKNELKDPTDQEINAYLAGNLCRCTGYESHLRAIRAYLAGEEGEEGAEG